MAQAGLRSKESHNVEVSGSKRSNMHRYHPLAPLKNFGVIRVFL